MEVFEVVQVKDFYLISDSSRTTLRQDLFFQKNKYFYSLLLAEVKIGTASFAINSKPTSKIEFLFLILCFT